MSPVIVLPGISAKTPIIHILGRANLREQVKPLLFGDGLLSQELQNYGTHQVPFILELKGAFVLGTQEENVLHDLNC